MVSGIWGKGEGITTSMDRVTGTERMKAGGKGMHGSAKRDGYAAPRSSLSWY